MDDRTTAARPRPALASALGRLLGGGRQASARDEDAQADEGPSLPLYAAGLVVTLCGESTINTAIGDPNLTATTVLLAVVGFIFSVGCRLFGIRTRLPEILGLAIGAYFAYGFATGAIDPMEMIRQGGDVNQLEIAKALDWAMVLCAWSLVSDDFVVFCGLLAIAGYGVVGSITTNVGVPGFMLFVLAMTFLLLHHHYRQRRAVAPPGERDREQLRPLIVQGSVALVSTAAVIILASLLIVPAQMVFARVSLVQAIRKLTALGTGQISQQAGPVVSDDADLDVGTGQGFGSDTTVIAQVVPGDGAGHYWRARTYDRYTGAGWNSTMAGDEIQLGFATARNGLTVTIPDGTFPGQVPAWQTQDRRTISSTVHVMANMPELLAAADPAEFLVPTRDATMEAHRDGHIELTSTGGGSYQYISTSLLAPVATDPAMARRLRRASGDIPADIAQLYTGDPENDITTGDDVRYFKDVVKSILDPLPPARRNEFDKAMAISQYVSRTAVYSLDVSPLPAETDHVRAFLQDTRKGYCDMFASSMAVLCRVAGIPARVATGFAPGDNAGTAWNLRSMDKHAWVEVYFPHNGWVTFDPTSDAATDTSVPTAQTTAASPMTGYWRRFLVRRPVTLALILAIVAIIAFVVVTEIRDRFRGRVQSGADPAQVRSQIGRAYHRVLRAIGALGMPRRPSETPYEYQERVRPYLQRVGEIVRVPLPPDTFDVLTETFVQARYAAAPAEAERIADPVSAFLRLLLRARVRLLFARLLRRAPATLL